VSAPTGPGRRHPRREAPATLQLRVQLEGAFPPVWRRIEVASDLGLDDLHAVLQVVFGWQDYHLYRFASGPQDDPGAAFACTADLAEAYDDEPAAPTWDVRIDELLAVPGERLHYQYDYGDNWWVAIEVEDVVDGHVPPGRARLLEGAGAGPPEDCGGIHGYRMIVAASDLTHPDHRQALVDVWGSVAEQETSLAAVLESMLQVPDHWRAFAAHYLEILDEAADRTPGTPRHRSRSTGGDRTAGTRALADWHTLLVERLSGSEDEDLLDRLVDHPALAGPERTRLRAQLASRRG
jgi:hypothetical protein